MAQLKELIWIDLCEATRKMELPEKIHEEWILNRAGNMNNALHALALPDAKACAVVVDIGSSSFGCIESIHALKRAYPTLPVVLVCNSYSPQVLLWGLRMRIWNIFQKPVDVAQIAQCLNLFIMLHKQCSGYAYAVPVCDQFNIKDVDKNFSNSTKKTDAALAYISSCYQEKISLPHLAWLSNMSVRKFSDVFMEEQGITFRDFISSYRVARARELIDQKHYSITDVAYQVGFADVANFSRAFKRWTGECPAVYRRKRQSTFLMNSIEE